MSLSKEIFDLAIIGSGIVGSSVIYTVTKYTNINNIAIFEKNIEAGLGNSDFSKNSKTLHEGFAETNYSIDKMYRMKVAGKLFRNYLSKNDFEKFNFKREEIFSYLSYFVLAIENEVKFLEEKYKRIVKAFPDVKLLNAKEIEKIEPALMNGRSKGEKVEALYKKDGVSINFGKLSKIFIKEASKSKKKVSYRFNEEVLSLEERDDLYEIKTKKGKYLAKTVFVSSSANSFYLAKKMGYLENYSLVNIRGNYCMYPNVIKSKVYRVQIEKIPFVEIHADPNPFLKDTPVEFGPTAEFVLSKDYYKDIEFSYILDEVIKNPSFVRSLYGILKDEEIRKFLTKNVIYRIPIVGKSFFAKQAKKIIPKLKENLLIFRKGGIRPQLIDNAQRKLILGEKLFVFNNLIFAITPSPGASASLLNAIEVTSLISKMLGKEIYLDSIIKYFEIDEEDLKFINL